MEKKYAVLDQDGNPAGTLLLAICEEYAALDAVMPFRRLEGFAASEHLPSPASFGFQYFKGQLPVTEIYPIAVLEDVLTDPAKRRRGIGRRAVRGFRAVADEYGCRLGLLRIGTELDGELQTEQEWRRRFYESEGWRAFQSPPIKGLFVIWMYHLLPPLSQAERELRNCLTEKLLREDPCGAGPVGEELG